MKEKTNQQFSFNKIWCAAVAVILHSAVESRGVLAQQTQVPVIGGGGTGSGATSSINDVMQFIIDQMLAVGATVSVVVALGVIFAVKIGWMQRRQIMDWAWLVILMISLPTLIPAIFTFAGS